MSLRSIRQILIFLAMPSLVFAKPPSRQHGVLSGMESVTCGSDEKGGPTVAGRLITGAQHHKTKEVLCQEYMIKADRVTYRVRPTDEKHPRLLPVGEYVEFRLTKDKMRLRVPEVDNKEREYAVIAAQATPELDRALEQTRRPPKPHTGTLLSLEPGAPPTNASGPAAVEPGLRTEGAPAQDAEAVETVPEQSMPATPPAATTGVVQIQSAPSGAQVFVDSSEAGKTPILLNLQAGIHSIQVVMGGYNDWVQSITVTPGQRRQVSANLSH